MLHSTGAGAATRCLITLAIIALAAAGCGNPNAPEACTAQYVYGLTVMVHDKATGQPICDAQVTTIVSATETETLKLLDFPPECRYVGAGERAGVYGISVVKEGYAPATLNNIRVDRDSCHVIPVRLTIALDRL
jgi:hypothetical protein